MGSSNSTNLLLCWQDFHSIRALLAVSRAGCNHDSVVIFTMNQWRFRIIFLLSCLFSAYTFFLLHLFARWLDETLYWVWGCIPGSLMIKLSVSGCCLGRAFARYSATTELEKVCNSILLRPQKKKIRGREENTDPQKSAFMDFDFTVHVYLAAYRLTGWRAWIALVKTQFGSVHHKTLPPEWIRSSKESWFYTEPLDHYHGPYTQSPPWQKALSHCSFWTLF